MRRTENPRVDRLLAGRAYLAHASLLDRAQQLHLHRQRQFGNLVEEQRAAGRGMEEAVAIALGPGKGAFPVAEELGFHQRFGDRPAVDRNERQQSTRRRIVDRPRDQFLAAAGLTVDRHRGHAVRQPLDHRSQLPHGRRLAAQPVDAARPLLLRRRAGGRRAGQRRPDQQPELIQIDRLGQVIEGAGLQGGHRVLGAAVGGDHRDRRVAAGADLPHQFDAGAVRQPHVGQAQRVAVAGEQVAGAAEGVGGIDIEAKTPKRQRQQFTQIRLVVDHQHRRQPPLAGGACRRGPGLTHRESS